MINVWIYYIRMGFVYEDLDNVQNSFETEKFEILYRTKCLFWKCDFWSSVFYHVVKQHTFHSNFYLIGSNIDYNYIAKYYTRSFSNLSIKYNLSFSKLIFSKRTEFIISFSQNYMNKKYPNSNEILVTIDSKYITLNILPFSRFCRHYILDDYLLLEDILSAFISSLFLQYSAEIHHFLLLFQKIDKCTENMNIKTIQIAQTSIQSIFQTISALDKKLIQKNLYSCITIKSKEFTVLHNDFLTNPTNLLDKLNNENNVGSF